MTEPDRPDMHVHHAEQVQHDPERDHEALVWRRKRHYRRLALVTAAIWLIFLGAMVLAGELP